MSETERDRIRYVLNNETLGACDCNDCVSAIARLLTEARAEALREAADDLDYLASGGSAFNAAARLLRDRAARIARTAAQRECPRGGQHEPLAAGDANDGGPVHCRKCQAPMRARTAAQPATSTEEER